MSTPISRLAAGLACLAAAGCVPAIDVGRAPPARFALVESSLVIAGPPGYCVDRASSRLRANGSAFVLLGSCASIAGNARAPKPGTRGLLTVSVTEAVADEASVAALLGDMTDFLGTPEGRAALSRDGDPASVRVLDTRAEGDTLYIRVRDRGGPDKGMEADYWRALFGVNDRLLTATVVGFADAPVADEAGLSTLDALARRIRAESSAGAE